MATAVLLVVPSDREQFWVSFGETVEPASTKRNYEYSKEHAEKDIRAPSLLDRPVSEIV